MTGRPLSLLPCTNNLFPSSKLLEEIGPYSKALPGSIVYTACPMATEFVQSDEAWSCLLTRPCIQQNAQAWKIWTGQQRLMISGSFSKKTRRIPKA